MSFLDWYMKACTTCDNWHCTLLGRPVAGSLPFNWSWVAKIAKFGPCENFLLYGILEDGHNLTELHWGRQGLGTMTEATITSVKLFLFDILYVRSCKKICTLGWVPIGHNTFQALRDTTILHIKDMYATRQMLIYLSHKTCLALLLNIMTRQLDSRNSPSLIFLSSVHSIQHESSGNKALSWGPKYCHTNRKCSRRPKIKTLNNGLLTACIIFLDCKNRLLTNALPTSPISILKW